MSSYCRCCGNIKGQTEHCSGCQKQRLSTESMHVDPIMQAAARLIPLMRRDEARRCWILPDAILKRPVFLSNRVERPPVP